VTWRACRILRRRCSVCRRCQQIKHIYFTYSSIYSFKERINTLSRNRRTSDVRIGLHILSKQANDLASCQFKAKHKGPKTVYICHHTVTASLNYFVKYKFSKTWWYMFSNQFITNFPQNMPVKKIDNRSIFGEDMDKSLQLTFLGNLLYSPQSGQVTFL